MSNGTSCPGDLTESESDTQVSRRYLPIDHCDVTPHGQTTWLVMNVATMSKRNAAKPSNDEPAATAATCNLAKQRRKRLLRVRHAVLRGDYENALKLSIAADRLFDRIVPDGRSSPR